MFTPKCLAGEHALENVKEDFQGARRVEQYRVGKAALYFPEGLRWNYLPLDAVTEVRESFRVISGGHCVPIREKRPEIDLVTAAGVYHVSLEKEDSMQAILEMLKK